LENLSLEFTELLASNNSMPRQVEHLEEGGLDGVETPKTQMAPRSPDLLLSREDDGLEVRSIHTSYMRYIDMYIHITMLHAPYHPSSSGIVRGGSRPNPSILATYPNPTSRITIIFYTQVTSTSQSWMRPRSGGFAFPVKVILTIHLSCSSLTIVSYNTP